MSELKIPTEQVTLPSKGLLYPEDNPLSKGVVEIKYMTAKEEDILTNQTYIQKGNVLDKLLESLVVSEINLDDLIVGDKNAILIAARVLGYGGDYKFTMGGSEQVVNLSELENKHFDETAINKGKNEFEFTLPHSKNKVTFKILTGHDEKKLEAELKGLKRISPESSPELTTRLKYIITSVEENSDTKAVRDFIDNYLLARDSRALREHIKTVQPDVDLTYVSDSGEEATIPINLNFFWPDL